MLVPPKRTTLEPIRHKKGEFEESEGHRFSKVRSLLYLEKCAAYKTMQFKLIYPDRLGSFVVG